MVITTFHDNQNPLWKVIFKIMVANSAEFSSSKLSGSHNLYHDYISDINNSFIYFIFNLSLSCLIYVHPNTEDSVFSLNTNLDHLPIYIVLFQFKIYFSFTFSLEKQHLFQKDLRKRRNFFTYEKHKQCPSLSCFPVTHH